MRLSQIKAATASWSQPKGRRCDWSASARARTRFVDHAVRWLRFLGWLDEADEVRRHTHSAEIKSFEAWMRSDRGLSEATIRDYRAAADQFFDWLAAADIPLALVKVTDIDRVIADKKARGTYGRRAMHDYAQRLRAFFRFAEARGWCTLGIANGMMPPGFKRDEAVPKGLKRDLLMLRVRDAGRDPRDSSFTRSQLPLPVAQRRVRLPRPGALWTAQCVRASAPARRPAQYPANRH